MKRAFTLAEVLITLGIIAVVAMVTIPSIIQKTNDMAYRSAWKENFSVLNQAFERVKAENGGDVSTYFDGSGLSGLFTAMEKYLYLENIGSLKLNNGEAVWLYMWNNEYKTLSGGYLSYHNVYGIYRRIKNGGCYFGRYDNSGGFSGANMIVWIDVNGVLKGPNTLGKDTFGAMITRTRILPLGAANTGYEDTCNTNTATCKGPSLDGRGDCAGAGCSYEYLISK